MFEADWKLIEDKIPKLLKDDENEKKKVYQLLKPSAGNTN